ncbi:MAG: transporter substrate-binding domain-containing protein [Clostridia bacterium]|nr:transporter substrate-binding domain-containing protein [Clostridia bacterium]
MKKKIIVALLLCLITLTSVFAFAGCDTTTDGSNLEGFDIELAKLVAQDLGVNARFRLISWGAKEMELQNKSIDLIWNGLTITDERLGQFCIGTPYMNNKQIAIIRKADSEKYTNLDNIKNAKFAYEEGSAGQDVAKENKFANATGLGAQVDALIEVQAGTSDIALLDSVLGNFYCQEGTDYSDLMIIPDLVFTVEQYGIAARKSDIGTIDKINTSLAKLQANGELAKLAQKYGLESELCDVSYESKWDTLTDEEKSGWNYIVNKGRFVVGYTLYAPIAYEA